MNTSLVYKTLATDKSIGSLILRVGTGIIFIPHGAQKLFGWWGGYGLQGTGEFFGSIGLEPGVLMAFLAGAAEFFGGFALVLGLLTRPAAAVLAFTMVVAIFAVHFSSGFFLSNGGYEYGFALLVTSLALLFSGAGAVSVDRALADRGAR